MGNVISYKQYLANKPQYRLIVYCSQTNNDAATSINHLLAQELLKLGTRMRSMQMEKCLVRVLQSLPENPIVSGIDVMFNPNYAIDVMKVLTSAYKQHPFSLIWPGTCDGYVLAYAEDGFRDFKEYEISDYDIVCVR